MNGEEGVWIKKNKRNDVSEISRCYFCPVIDLAQNYFKNHCYAMYAKRIKINTDKLWEIITILVFNTT